MKKRKLEASPAKISPPGRDLHIRPLTLDQWPALEDLFADSSVTRQCWCMYWRIGSSYGKRPAEENRRDFHGLVGEGPPPGLLAFEGELAIGWCQLTPKSVLASLGRRAFLQTAGQPSAWCVSCFYVRKGYRRRGVTAALIAEAMRFARAAGAPALEAYPLDPSRTPRATYTGYMRTFERLGFRVVSAPDAARPVLRYGFDSALG